MTKPRRQLDKRDSACILSILLLGLLVRSVYFFHYKNASVFPLSTYSDAYSYFLWAKDIASGQLIAAQAFMKWPLYAYVLAGIFRLLGENVQLVYFLQFLLGTASCILVYFAGKMLAGRLAGLIAALLCLHYGIFLFYEGMLIYTSLSVFLNLLLFLYFLKIQDAPTPKRLFFAGLLGGAACLVQANGLILALSSALVVSFRFAQRLKIFASFIAGAFTILALAVAANFAAERDFVLISGNTGINLFVGNNPEASGTFYLPQEIGLSQEEMFRDSRVIAEARLGRPLKTSQVNDYWLGQALDFMRKEPIRASKIFFRKLTLLFSAAEHVHEAEFQAFPGGSRGGLPFLAWDLRVILALALVGICLSLKSPAAFGLLYAAIFSLSLSIAVFFVTTRYRIPIVPFLALFAGMVADRLRVLIKGKRYFLLGLLVAFVLVSYLFFGFEVEVGRGWSKRSIIEHYLENASFFEQKNEPRVALEELYKARMLEPQNKRVIFKIGALYYGLGEFSKAEASFRDVLLFCPLCVDAYYNLGLIFNQTGRVNEAIPLLETAAKLDSRDTGVHFELGKAYMGSGQQEKARREFELTLKGLGRWRTQERAMVEKELERLVEK